MSLSKKCLHFCLVYAIFLRNVKYYQVAASDSYVGEKLYSRDIRVERPLPGYVPNHHGLINYKDTNA
jgi:hypothetical protein